MSVEAHLADGTILQFPDGTPDAVVSRTVKNRIRETTQAAANPGVSGWDRVGRAAESLYSGAAEGVSQLIDAGGKAADAMGRATATGLASGFNPVTGQAMPVQEETVPLLQQAGQDFTPHIAPATSATAAAVKAHAAGVMPANPTGLERGVRAVGRFAPPLAAALVSPVAGAAAFGVQGYGQGSDEALAAGASPQTAQTAGSLDALIQGGLGMVPFGRAVDAALPAAKTAVGRAVQPVLAHMAGDAVMGGGMKVGENVVAQQNYDPNRNIDEGTGEAALGMAAMGGLLHVAVKLPGGAKALLDHFQSKGIDAHKVDVNNMPPEAMAEAVADPRVQAILDANGIAPDHPGRAAAEQTITARLQARDAAAADPHAAVEPDSFRAPQRPEGAPKPTEAELAGSRVDQTVDFREQQRAQDADMLARSQLDPSSPDYVHPSRLRPEPAPADNVAITPAPAPEAKRIWTPEDVRPEVHMAEAPRGQDPNTNAGQDLRGKSNLPAVVEPQARPMSDHEVARAQAEPNRNPIPARDTLAAPEGRAPQTRDDVQGQREAGGAFDLAARQSARVEPGVRDTQAGGLPEGPVAEKVLMDEGFPVQVTKDLGRGRVEVQRYDPRTGKLDPDGVPYETHKAALSQKPYTPEPRRAQDFAARDNVAVSPETIRGADAPVGREPTQTFRETPADGGEHPFGGEGRSPLPEQPAGPHPGREQPSGERAQRATNEEELRQRYERAQQDHADADREAAARAHKAGGSSNTPAPKDPEGRFPVTDEGYVKSDKGGPVVFKEQKQAAKWITGVGHKESPDQIFEIANHPTVKARETGRSSENAYTVVERGRTESPPEPEPSARPGETTPPENQNVLSGKVSPGESSPGQKFTAREDGARAGNEAEDSAAFREMAQGVAKAHERRQIVAAEGSDWANRAERDAKAASSLDDDALESALREAQKNADDMQAARDTASPKSLSAQLARVQDARDALREESRARISASTKHLDDKLDAYEKSKGEKPKGGGHTLYSGVDPDLVKRELIEPAIAAVKAIAQKIATTLKTSGSLEAYKRFQNHAMFSVAGGLRDFSKKYRAVPEIGQLADHLATDPGSGRVTSEPYEYAARRRGAEGFNAAKNVLDDWGKATKITAEGIRKAMSGGSISAADRPFVTRLRAILEKQHRYLGSAGLEVGHVENFFPRVPDPQAVAKDEAGFVEAATKVYTAEGSADPKAAAEAWKEEILTGGDLHVSRAPGASLTTRSTRERTFKTPAVDKHLAGFMQDPKATLASYFQRTAQQAEFSRRFGAKGEKLDEMFAAMRKKGVSADDLNTIRGMTDAALGLLPGIKHTPVSGALGWVNTTYTMLTLARSLSAQVTEPWTAAITTGDVGVGLKAMGEYLAPLTKGGRLSREEMADRAELMGVMSDITNDAMQLNRQGAAGESTAKQSALLTGFFKAIGVHGITDYQTASAAKIAEWYLRRQLNDMAKPDNAPALRALADQFGMDEATARKVAAWAAKHGDQPPPVSEFLGGSKEGDSYKEAIYRFATQNVQNPTRADRPAAAADPRYHLAYGLTSFLYTFTRKVTIKMMRDMSNNLDPNSGYTAGQRAQSALGLATAYGVYAAANYGVWYARQMALNPQSLEEMSPQQAAYTALTASQSLGTAQPLIDMGVTVMGRFGRDLSSAYTGPYLSGALTDVAAMGKGLEGGSDKTNNAEWAGTRAAYHAIVAPLILRKLTEMSMELAPGGALAHVGLFAAIQAVGAPGTSRLVADKVAGERKIKPHGKPVDQSRSKSTTGDIGDIGLGSVTDLGS